MSIKKTEAINTKQILFMTQPYAAVGVVVGNTGVTAGEDGRKILKAGTPIAGDLTARTTAFTQAVDSGSGTTTSNAVAVLVHDVDVTDGNANATALIFGFVDKNKLDATVKTLWTTAAISALGSLGIKLLA